MSFVIPVHNGEQWLDRVLRGVLAQNDGRPFEVVLVDDGSTDRSVELLAVYARDGRIRLVRGPQRGATAAINEGIRHATHPIICQVDQDVILQPGWMSSLARHLQDSRVAAAQGYYVTPPDATAWARVTGLDLEDRYRRLIGRPVNHVCTGNTAYRGSALHGVGLFDEALGYGYDNDISYRLAEAGYSLVIDPSARSYHCWRDDWRTYLVQQYGFGYGRLDLVAKHRRRLSGDDVSGPMMMLHAPLMGAALLAMILASVARAAGGSPRAFIWAAVVIVSVLILERFAAGVRAALRFRDPAGLLFVPMHLARDLAWLAAIIVWSTRRLCGMRSRPSDSMRPRTVSRSAPDRHSS